MIWFMTDAVLLAARNPERARPAKSHAALQARAAPIAYATSVPCPDDNQSVTLRGPLAGLHHCARHRERWIQVMTESGQPCHCLRQWLVTRRMPTRVPIVATPT